MVTHSHNDTASTTSTNADDEPSTSSSQLVTATTNADPEIAFVQKKSWTALQRSLVMCHEMDVCGKLTLEKLAEAGVKFQHLDDFHTKIERDLMETAVHLDDMQKCCFGLCPNPWAKKTGAMAVAAAEEALDAVGAGAVPANQQPAVKEYPKLEPFMLIDNDYVEKQMEKSLDVMDGYLERLENISDDIGNRLGVERRVIDAATDAVDKNIMRTTLARKKALAALRTV